MPSAITINISLPEPLKRFVDERVASGLYDSASEFVREAVREKLAREQERERAKAELTNLLLEGLDSGEPVPFTDDYMNGRIEAFKAGRRAGQPDQ